MNHPPIDLSVIEGLTDNSQRTVKNWEEWDARDRFRVTGLERFEECPRRWQGELFGAVQDVGRGRSRKVDYARIGTAVHHVIEGFVKRAWSFEDGGWPEQEAYLLAETVNPKERDKCKRYCQELLNRNVEVVAVETKIRCRFRPDLPELVGTLDLLLWDIDNRAWLVVDHKTNRGFEGEEVWRYKLQPLSYAATLRETVGPEYPIQYEIGYVNLGKRVQWATAPSDDVMVYDAYARVMEEFRVYRRHSEWPERINGWCCNCPLQDSCHAAQQVFGAWAALVDDQDKTEPSALQRYKWTAEVGKLVDNRLGDLREEIRQAILDRADQATPSELREGDLQAILTTRRQRHARASSVLGLLTQLPAGAMGAEEIDELFSVRMGGLDKTVERLPGLALSLVGLVEQKESDEPTLTVRSAPVKKKI